MNITAMKRIAALALALLLCVSLAACGSDTEAGAETEESKYTYASAGGSVTLPADLFAPETDNTLTTALVDGTISGAFTTINSKGTSYFQTTGTVTVTVSATMNTQTKWTDAHFALWKKTGDVAEFVQTVHFTCDGTAQTCTFSGLDTAAQYRVVFTYSDVPSYKMSGQFNVSGVTTESEEAVVAAEE